MSSWTSWLRQCLRLSLFPTPVIFLKISGNMFSKISFNWNMSDVFIMIKLELWVLGKKSTEVQCHFCYIISKVQTIKLLMTVDAYSDHISQVMVIRLLLCKLALFFLFQHRKFKFISFVAHTSSCSFELWSSILPCDLIAV